MRLSAPSPVSPWSAARPRRKPLVYTAMDLSHVAPAPRLAAENGRILIGLLVAAPISLGLWALLWVLTVG